MWKLHFHQLKKHPFVDIIKPNLISRNIKTYRKNFGDKNEQKY